jgi:ornithine carbamoyltransferase
MNLVSLSGITAKDVRAIWALVAAPTRPRRGTVGWSFEGNGIRTRTTFVQAFRELGLACIELPSLLKTSERVCDLAGYLDSFYDLYVIRESNHARLAEFAAASRKPVVNAMSSQGHPCEVLSDAYFVETSVRPLSQARVCLWGPPTNVLRSWHELAQVLDLQVVHACERQFHESKPNVRFVESIDGHADIVITDAWPTGYENPTWSLNATHLERLGSPRLLPTPPFSVGREVALDPVLYEGFVGYQQKAILLRVQKAILSHVTEGSQETPIK